MKISYIAHPIGGDVESNMEKITEIIRKVNLEESDTVPFAPYYADIYALDDEVIIERNRGIRNDVELLNRGFIDEIRLYGDRISNGMMEEVKLGEELGIKIVPMTEQTKNQYKEIK